LLKCYAATDFGLRLLVGRLHLFEFEDQAWLPSVIRDGMTGILNIIEQKAKLYITIVPCLKNVLRELKCEKIVDLCSGSGGPWKYLIGRLADSETSSLEVFLSDKFPSFNILELDAFQASKLKFVPYPVDAINVPKELTGFRTIFGSFHHFRPKEAVGILQDVVKCREGIALFEMTQRNWFSIMYILFLGSIAVLFFIPFVKPFRWLRLILTYLVPLIPFVFVFDGIVSCLRTYSLEDLQMMVKKIRGNNLYNWEIGVKKCERFPGGITYLIGYPKTNTSII
jgi:hypothetical protein